MSLKALNNADRAAVFGSVKVLGKVDGSNIRTIKTTVNALAAAVAVQAAKTDNWWSALASDLIITPTEKRTLYLQWKQIQSAYTSLLQLADEAGIEDDIDILTDFKVGYDELYKYLYSTAKIFDDMSSNTTIRDREAFNLLFTNFYDDEYAVQNYINGSRTQALVADSAMVFLNVTNENIHIPVDSSGNVLSGILPMTVTAGLYAGSTPITSGVSFSVTEKDGISINKTLGIITIAEGASLADYTELTVTCLYNNVTYTAKVGITKIYNGYSQPRYEIEPSADYAVYKDNVMSPNVLTAKVTKMTGAGEPLTVTYGVMKYQTALCDAPVDFPSGGLTLTPDMGYVYLYLYAADGITLQDKEKVPVVVDSDSYTAVLENGTVTYVATNDEGYIAAKTVIAEVHIYKGSKEVTCVIGDLPTVAGFSLTKNGRKITITAAAGTAMDTSGKIAIPVSVYEWNNRQVHGRGNTVYGRDGQVYGRLRHTKAYGRDGKVYGRAGNIRGCRYRKMEGTIVSFIVYFEYSKISNTSAVLTYDTTPRYLGPLESMPVTANLGDVVLYAGATDDDYTLGTMYRWNGSAWKVLDTTSAANSAMVQSAMTDLFALCAGMTTAQAPVYAKTLTALTAIIKMLFVDTAFIDTLTTKELILKDDGMIKSNTFDYATKGVKITAAGDIISVNGTFKNGIFDKGTFDNIEVMNNSKFYGEIYSGPLTLKNSSTNTWSITLAAGLNAQECLEQLTNKGFSVSVNTEVIENIYTCNYNTMSLATDSKYGSASITGLKIDICYSSSGIAFMWLLYVLVNSTWTLVAHKFNSKNIINLSQQIYATTHNESDKTMILSNIPTADPHTAGYVWNNNGVVTISAG